MVIVTGGEGNKFGGSVHIEMDGDRGPFVEVTIAPDPDMLHGPPLVNLLAPNDQALPLSPEYLLSQEIKEYEELDDGNTITNIVVSFNSNLLYSRYKPSSPTYDASIDIDVLCTEIFCVDEWWNTRDDLVCALKLFGDLKGFYPTLKNGAIRCNRFGDKEYIRNFMGGDFNVNAHFSSTLKPDSIQKRQI